MAPGHNKYLTKYAECFEDLNKNYFSGDSLKNCMSSCKRILDVLRKSFVEEFARKSAIRKNNDVLFIEGIDQPTSEMILVKKILLDNQVIRLLTEDLKDGDVVTELKANMSSLKSVLAASTDFLVKILSAKQLACLCLNVFKLVPEKFKLSKLAMRQMLTLSGDPIVIEYLKQVRNFNFYILKFSKFINYFFFFKQSVCLGVMMLRLVFSSAEKNREHLNETIENYVEKNPEGLIGNLMPTWKIAQSEEKKPSKIIKRLYGKLVSVMKGPEMMKLSKMIMNGKTHQNEELFSVAILVFAEVVKNEPETDLIMQLIQLILWATKRFTIRKPRKERNEPHTNIIYATESAAISSLVLKSGSYIFLFKHILMFVDIC